MNCQDAQGLIQGYLDGEISEAQAGPLRKHLLECTACRTMTQEGKALKAWFVDGDPVEVPSGFAARVARRAFAGDTGIEQPLVSRPTRAAAEEGRLLSFVLQTTAAAAALLLALSIGMRMEERPSTGELRADDATKESILQELDRLNASSKLDGEASAAMPEMAEMAPMPKMSEMDEMPRMEEMGQMGALGGDDGDRR